MVALILGVSSFRPLEALVFPVAEKYCQVNRRQETSSANSRLHIT